MGRWSRSSEVELRRRLAGVWAMRQTGESSVVVVGRWPVPDLVAHGEESADHVGHRVQSLLRGEQVRNILNPRVGCVKRLHDL